MEGLLVIIGIIVSVFILKELFKKKNPFLKRRGVAGLFIAPVLQIACMGIFLYDALHPNLVNTNNFWGMALSFINEQRGSNAESLYYESFATFSAVAKICFLITICSAGYLIYKLFDDDECNKSLMNILIGIGTVACLVTIYFNGQFFTSFMHYLGQKSDDMFIISFLIIAAAILLWAWYYFSATLKDILALSTSESEVMPTITTNSENTIANKTQDLIKLKNLLDSGVLTQEEFDIQKKQILNS